MYVYINKFRYKLEQKSQVMLCKGTWIWVVYILMYVAIFVDAFFEVALIHNAIWPKGTGQSPILKAEHNQCVFEEPQTPLLSIRANITGLELLSLSHCLVWLGCASLCILMFVATESIIATKDHNSVSCLVQENQCIFCGIWLHGSQHVWPRR